MRLLGCFLITFCLLAGLSFAQLTSEKTQGGFTVGINPISIVYGNDSNQYCFWAKVPTTLSSAPTLSKSAFQFIKELNISNITTKLVERKLVLNTYNYTHENCTGDFENQTCQNITEEKTDSWYEYPTKSQSGEVVYCFDKPVEKTKEGHVLLTPYHFNISIGSYKADPDISACTNLSSPNTEYDMTASTSDTGTCMNVTAANVTLNCASFNITGDNTASHYGVNVSDQFNTSIKNCNITNFQVGISVTGDASDFLNISNSTIRTFYTTSCATNTAPCHALFISDADNISITDSYFNGSSLSTLIYYTSLTSIASKDIYIHNSTFLSGSYALLVAGVQRATVDNNTLLSTASSFAFRSDNSNQVNFTNNVAKAVSAGSTVVILASNNTNISHNNITTNTGSSFAISLSSGGYNNTVEYNWATARGGAISTSSGTQDNLTVQYNTIPGDGAGGDVVDFSGLTNSLIQYNNLTATGNTAVFTQTIANVIIQYNQIVGSSVPVYFDSGTATNITFAFNNVTSTGNRAIGCLDTTTACINFTIADNLLNSSGTLNTRGTIYFFKTTNSLIANNTIRAKGTNTERAILLTSSSKNNIFINNTIIANTSSTSTPSIDVSASTCTNNTFILNNITQGASGIWINDATTLNSNFYNDSTRGNIYYLFKNESPSWLATTTPSNVSMWDTNGDTWADSGGSIPFNATTVGGNFTGTVQDWHPYTTNSTFASTGVFFNNSAINLTPSNPAVGDTIGCAMALYSSVATNPNVSVNWFVNGVNVTAFAIYNTSYTNGSEWNITTTPTSLGAVAGDTIYCSAQGNDSGTYSTYTQSQIINVASLDTCTPPMNPCANWSVNLADNCRVFNWTLDMANGWTCAPVGIYYYGVGSLFIYNVSVNMTTLIRNDTSHGTTLIEFHQYGGQALIYTTGRIT